jgi:hypothetical protein
MVCDGFCDGFLFYKSFSINMCDGSKGGWLDGPGAAISKIRFAPKEISP